MITPKIYYYTYTHYTTKTYTTTEKIHTKLTQNTRLETQHPNPNTTNNIIAHRNNHNKTSHDISITQLKIKARNQITNKPSKQMPHFNTRHLNYPHQTIYAASLL